MVLALWRPLVVTCLIMVLGLSTIACQWDGEATPTGRQERGSGPSATLTTSPTDALTSAMEATPVSPVAASSTSAVPGSGVQSATSVSTAADWPQLARDSQRTGASPQRVDGPYRFYWRWIDVPIASRAQPVVSGSRLFIGGLNGVMYALDATYDAQGGNPRVLWQRDLQSPVRAGAAVNGDVVIVGTHHGTIHGLDASSGESRWSVSTGGAVLSAPLLRERVAYLGSADGTFYAISTTDGSVVWRQPIGVPILGSAALSDDGRLVFFAAENLVAYALAADSGAVVWQTQLYGQSAADRWPVVLGDQVVFRTMPIHNFQTSLRNGDEVLDSAGSRLLDWDADWAIVRPRIVDYLAANPHHQTFFSLDALTGQLTGIAPILYTFGNQDPPAPPVVYDQALYLPYRSRHGIQTDSLVGVHVTTRYDAELGRMNPVSLDITPLTSPDSFSYQFRLTSDEPAVLSVAGDLLLVDSWERLGTIDLETGAMVGIAQTAHNALPCHRDRSPNDDLMPFFETCPFPGPQSGEGDARTGAVAAAGRVFWKPSNGLAAIGPGRESASRAPVPASPSVPTTVTSDPTVVSAGALVDYVWTEPFQPTDIPVEQRLRLEHEIERIVSSDEHLMPYFLERGFHGPGSWPADVANGDEPASVGESASYWFDPGELVLTLSLAYPYLNPALQTRLRSYLQIEMTRFPPLENLPWPADSWLKQGRARELYAVPMRDSLNTWPPPGVSIQTLYSLWAYARYTGDWDYVASRWDQVQALFETKKESIDSYGEIAGAIGYARLARHLGNSAEALVGESVAVRAMESGLDFDGWRNRANALYPPDPMRPEEKPGARAAVFFGLTPEVGRYLRETNLQAVKSTLDDLIGYPNGNYLWYATRLGIQAEKGESSYHSPEIGWAVFLAQAYILHQPQAQLCYWLDRPWGLGDLWHIQKLIATIQAPS